MGETESRSDSLPASDPQETLSVEGYNVDILDAVLDP
jgi:hypothetical protein